MKNFAIAIGIAALSALPVLADPVSGQTPLVAPPQAPTQSPAQLEASANPPPAPQMPSQAEKAEAKQSDKVATAAAPESGQKRDNRVHDGAAAERMTP